MKLGRKSTLIAIVLFLVCCGGNAPQISQPSLTSIAVSPSGEDFELPATQQFTATGHYSDGSSKSLTRSVIWSSSDTTVATISNNAGSHGVSTMVGSGSADVDALLGGVEGSASIKVSSTVTLSVSPSFASVTVTHQTQAFTPVVGGASNTAVTWSVDNVAGGNSTVGTISDSGVYTPPDEKGFHTITATSQADLSKTASAQVAVMDNPGVFTRQYDNARTGQNTDEIVLTPRNVNTQDFGKLFSYAVDGNIYAQPLYVANVNVPGLGYHNIVYVGTTKDTFYAFDADDPSVGAIWTKSLLDASKGETAAPCASLPANYCGFAPTVGITGTPVIDPSTGTLYVDTFSVIGGTYFYKLHALDITNGAEKFGGPVNIQGSVPGTGDSSDGTTVPFEPYYQLQRTGLLLANGNIYLTFAAGGDVRPYHGWVFAYNAATLQQVAEFNDTPDGYGGGIWQGAGGIAADAQGNIYVSSGNGDFNADTGGRDYGDSIIKFSPTLGVLDSFTPYNQAYLNNYDLDLGSSAPLLLPDQGGDHPHLLVADGKPATLYVVDRDKMGGFHAGDNSQIVQAMPGATSQVMTSPAYWNGHLYYGDLANSLKMFTVTNGQVSTNPQVYPTAARPQGLTVSANGTQDGILWVLHQKPYTTTKVLLAAHDATNLSPELYDSNQAGTRDVAGEAGVNFQVPVVVNGKVYVGTRGELDVYGLLPH